MKNINTKNNTELIPLVNYINADRDKIRIYKENENKLGICRSNNFLTNKSYMPSSINLRKRFNNYYSLSFINRIVNKNNSGIYNAILKYG